MISRSKNPFTWKKGTPTRGKEDHELHFRGRLFGTVRRSFHRKGYNVIITQHNPAEPFPTLTKAKEFLEGRVWQIVLREQAGAARHDKKTKAANFTKHVKSYQEGNDALDALSSINPHAFTFFDETAELEGGVTVTPPPRMTK